MKPVSVAVVGMAVLGCSWCTEAATTAMDIASCADLQVAAEATASGDILGMLVEEEIFCEEWLNAEITDNKLKLDGDVGTTYKFDKVRFVVKSGAVLRVEVPVEFTGEDPQTVNGGALNVERDARARFLSSVLMDSIGVDTVDLDNMVHGGCIYNQGLVRFEGEFNAYRCETESSIEEYRVAMGGNGAGIYNGEDGQVVFKGAVDIDFCGNRPWSSNGAEPGLDGGGIYTDGKVSFFQDAMLQRNMADEGGALWIGVSGVVKFLNNSTVTLMGNNASGNGGAINNNGVLVMRGEAYFNQGRSSVSGGCIYYGPVAESVFLKAVDFYGCQSAEDGGAIYIDYENIEFLPQEATYSSNSIVNNFDDEFKCEDIYVAGDGDDYICLP